MRMHRLINILLTLEGNKKITAKALAEELETSVRTIYRDVDILCEAGIPICTESGPGGGISLMKGYQTQIQHLDKEDIIYLYLNGLGVKADRSSFFHNHTDITLKKLEKTLPGKEVEELHTLKNRFVVDNNPWWGEKQSIPQIDFIVQAVWQLNKLYITYEKVNQTSSSRIVRPYGIAIKDNIWYLVGYCESSLTIRIFRCDRITECVLLNESFLYPEHFVLKQYFKSEMKDFKTNCNLAEQYAVTLSTTYEMLSMFKGLEYSMVKREDDRYEICVNLYSLENAQNDYWNIVINSKIISPIELRDAVRCKLENALYRYKDIKSQ